MKMLFLVKKRLTLSLYCLLFLLSACQFSPDPLPERLKLGGSTSVQPVALAGAEAFMRSQETNAEVIVRGGGSTYGIKGLVYGGLHIGMASRELSEDERNTWPNLVSTPIGRDGVAIIVNQELYAQGVTQLTLAQVADIWQGIIVNWSQVGGPDLPIMLYDRGNTSGTQGAFLSVVFADGPPPTINAAHVTAASTEVVSAVSQHLAAISILSVGYQTTDVAGLAIIDSASGEAIAPTTENISTGRYPLVRNLNLITLGQPRGLAAQFISFMLSSQGQIQVEKNGYIKVAQ